MPSISDIAIGDAVAELNARARLEEGIILLRRNFEVKVAQCLLVRHPGKDLEGTAVDPREVLVLSLLNPANDVRNLVLLELQLGRNHALRRLQRGDFPRQQLEQQPC